MENIRNYISLIAPALTIYDRDLDDIAKNWNIDWCTFEEYKLHIYRMWKLNKKNFNPNSGMNFQRFFNMQMIFLKETPTWVKFSMRKS